MSQPDKEEFTTITIPSGMPMTTVEQALRSAAEFEWSQKMSLLRVVLYLEEQNKKLIKAGDAFYESETGYYGEQILGDPKNHSGQMCRDWLAAKGVEL